MWKNIAEPKSFSELLDKICIDSSGSNFSTRFWRGQGDIAWPVHSTAYRRAEGSQSLAWEKDLRKRAVTSDQWMMSRARHQGFGFKSGRKINDWELITELRHFGASTSLLDVSKNPLVGLWFAAMSEPNRDGLLVGVHCEHVGGQEGKTEDEEYFEMLNEAATANYPYFFDPINVTPRVSAQSSCFLYGSGSESKMGTMIYEEMLDAYTFFKVSADLKSECLRVLNEVFNINRLSLFPDIEGFAQCNSVEYDIGADQRW